MFREDYMKDFNSFILHNSLPINDLFEKLATVKKFSLYGNIFFNVNLSKKFVKQKHFFNVNLSQNFFKAETFFSNVNLFEFFFQ